MSTLNYETPPRSDDVRPLLAPALMMFFLGTFGPPLFKPSNTTLTVTALIVCQSAAIALAIFLASQRVDRFRLIGLERNGLRRAWKTILIGFPVITAITYLTNFTTQLVLKHFDAIPEQNHPMFEIMQSGSIAQITLAIVCAVLIAPAFEEILFRGHFQTLFASLFGNVASILATSLLFTILHPWWTMPAIFVLSVMMGVVRWKTNSTWPSLAIHVLFNLTSTVFFLITNRVE